MRVKPKEVLLNLPIVLTFNEVERIPEFAETVNTLIHGEVKLKYEELGKLGDQYIGLFYLKRNDEFSTLRQEFKSMIEMEEIKEFEEAKVEKQCPMPRQYSGWCSACRTKHNEG